MKMFRSLLLSLPLAAFALMAPQREAQACGACFVPPDENTQVTGHRMIFATSMQQTTLYDQIKYTGAPGQFAWVLPIVGEVKVGLSSDVMFNVLDGMTQTTIEAPPPEPAKPEPAKPEPAKPEPAKPEPAKPQP